MTFDEYKTHYLELIELNKKIHIISPILKPQLQENIFQKSKLIDLYPNYKDKMIKLIYRYKTLNGNKLI